jgi:hypothetical protein
MDRLTGWLGLVLIHGATLPTLWDRLQGNDVSMPELSLVLMVWAGLICYFARAVIQRDVIYMVSNGIGFVFNSLLLTLIVFGG